MRGGWRTCARGRWRISTSLTALLGFIATVLCGARPRTMGRRQNGNQNSRFKRIRYRPSRSPQQRRLRPDPAKRCRLRGASPHTVAGENVGFMQTKNTGSVAGNGCTPGVASSRARNLACSACSVAIAIVLSSPFLTVIARAQCVYPDACFGFGVDGVTRFCQHGFAPCTRLQSGKFSCRGVSIYGPGVIGPHNNHCVCGSCPVDVGQHCVDDYDCIDSSGCLGGICRSGCSPYCAVGRSCIDGQDCESKTCLGGVCHPSCALDGCLDGTACVDNPDCDSFACVNHVCSSPPTETPARTPIATPTVMATESPIASPTVRSGCDPANATGACKLDEICVSKNAWASGNCVSLGSGQNGQGICRVACSPSCPNGSQCGYAGVNDCQSSNCVGEICRVSCAPNCRNGALCSDGLDCSEDKCVANKCRPACSPNCDLGFVGCVDNGDCSSLICQPRFSGELVCNKRMASSHAAARRPTTCECSARLQSTGRTSQHSSIGMPSALGRN